MRNKAFNRVIDNMRNHPQEWSIGEYRASNDKRKTTVWVANGYWFYNIVCNGLEINLSLFQKWKMLRAIRRLIGGIVSQQFK